jgi:hypothetical protein
VEGEGLPRSFPDILLLAALIAATGATLFAESSAVSPQRALLDRYCVTCHNQKLKTGGLMLDRIDLDKPAEGAEAWEKVIRQLRGGMMPPQGMPRPDKATLDSFVSWLEESIDRAASQNPGRDPLHRLNRTEYANAIRDLLDLRIEVNDLLPADDEANGFDNIADVLKVSPSLLEQYLAAARQIAALAVGDPSIKPISQVFRVPPDMAQDGHIEGLPLGTRGGILIHYNFPLDAEYDFSVKLLRNIVGYITGLEWPHQLEISIDGERVFLAPVGGEEDNKLMDSNLGIAGDALDARLKKRVRVTAGPHAVAVAFLRKSSTESDEPLQPFTRDLDLQNMNGIPLIDYVDISGPYQPSGSGDTPSRRRIFSCRPAAASDELPCAKKILTTLARRAYRRPINDQDLELLLSFYQAGRNRGTFDSGVESGLRLMLADPKFLFRASPDPANLAPGTIYPVSDLELASRLSFFLWSSIPDDQLLDTAAQGKLRDPAVLEQEVRRMLADARAEALVTDFAGQWLFLRNLKSAIPDREEFPNWDDNLRQAFRRETELFFQSIVREDRSVIDLLNADYTFVNERLARHYGIPNIYGSQFRRVRVSDENRRGLLGQGSVLTVTSYPNRTSPVLRGKWILENILGTPPPAPPPNVPALKENTEGAKPLTMRALLDLHRQNATCATCHKILDPLGFSLENFDAIGQWRTKEADGPVDASGELADGTKVDGPVALRNAVLSRSSQFAGTLTEKLLTYALGRGLEYYDTPVVRSIAREAAAKDYRFSAIVLGIARSVPFSMKRSSDVGQPFQAAAGRVGQALSPAKKQ